MSRVPEHKREQLSEEARRVHDEIMATRGEVDAPFQILLSSPELLERVAHLGSFLRYDSGLPARLRECIILATARELRCEFEWQGHEGQAREAGVSEAALEAIRAGELPAGESDERAVAALVFESLRENRVAEPTFRAVTDALGLAGATEALATLGYYSMLAHVINAFDVGR